MPRVIVASTNPVKLRAVQDGFQRMFPEQSFEFQGVSVPSGVSDQPASDAETLSGACGRVQAARELFPEADYWVGLEGGIEDEDQEMAAFAWVVIQGGERLSRARTVTFYLPPAVAHLIRQGVELGEADDRVFGRQNSKQENGAIGLLTGNVLDRAQAYAMAVILALTPFKNPHLYPLK